MWLVLLPQAVTVMMPAIVSQLVVLLKDTALGYIIGYQDLLSYGFQILPANYFGTRVSSAIVVATIYIGLSMTLSALANWLEQRSRRPAHVSVRRRAGALAPAGADRRRAGASAPASPITAQAKACALRGGSVGIKPPPFRSCNSGRPDRRSRRSRCFARLPWSANQSSELEG